MAVHNESSFSITESDAKAAARHLVEGLRRRTQEAEAKLERSYRENEELVKLLMQVENGGGPTMKQYQELYDENMKLKAALKIEEERVKVVAQNCARKLADVTQRLQEQEQELRALRSVSRRSS
eukprot:TRINITY_DN813_c1_g3_i1.p1 TRINITY_DN813_c1_g3~~TRINITY_DN813_c1_g3_i1.p1  ORF type:complete len:133 (+),score=39.58 TRINITY_DN813_c1_g3_i1:28-399(+)